MQDLRNNQSGASAAAAERAGMAKHRLNRESDRGKGRGELAVDDEIRRAHANSAQLAGLALLLSTIGIFALVANLVVQRTREIGIRIALGSTIRGAMVQIGRPGILASLAGLAAGLVLAAAVLRAMRSVLYGVQVYDAPTIAAVVATLALVTLLAVTLPTLRIAKIDPAKTLREE